MTSHNQLPTLGSRVGELIGESVFADIDAAANDGDERAIEQMAAFNAVLLHENQNLLATIPSFDQAKLIRHAVADPFLVRSIVHHLVERTAEFGKSLRSLAAICGGAPTQSTLTGVSAANVARRFAPPPGSVASHTEHAKPVRQSAAHPPHTYTEEQRRPPISAAAPANDRLPHPTPRDLRSLDKVRFFGAAAISFSEAQSRDYGDGRPVEETIMVEAAPRSSSANSRDPKTNYDWSKKISIQFSRPELLEILSVLNGYKNRAEFVGHGQANDKGFLIAREHADLHIMLRQKNRGVLRCQVSAAQAVSLISLILKQYLRSEMHLTAEMLLRSLKLNHQSSN